MNKIFLGLLTFAYTTASGQTWQEYYDSARLVRDNDRKQTVSLLHTAENLALRDIAQTPETYILIANDLCIAYWHLNDFRSAERYLKSSIAMDRSFALQNSVLLSTSLSIADTYVEQKNYVKAKKLMRVLLVSNTKLFDDSLYFETAQKLIKLYEDNNQTDSALQRWHEVNNLRYIAPSENLSLIAAQWRLTYSRLQYHLGNKDEALSALLSLRKILSAEKGTKISPASLQTLYALHTYYMDEGKPKSAKHYLQEAGRLIYSRGLENPMFTAELEYKFARLYEQSLQFKRSELHYEKCVTANQKLFGEKSVKAMLLERSLIDLRYRNGKTAAAIEGYENLLAKFSRIIPENDLQFISLLTKLGRAYKENNQYHRAYVYLRWASEIIETETTDKIIASEIHNTLADVYADKGDVVTAETHRQKASLIYNVMLSTESD